MSRWQAGLEKKQGFLGRLVDIGAELFAMTAACVRAKMLLDDGKADGKAAEGEGAVELALLFCRGSRRRVDRLFSELWHNDDDDNYGAAQKVLSGDYTWAEAGILDPSLMSPLVPGHEPTPRRRGVGSQGHIDGLQAPGAPGGLRANGPGRGWGPRLREEPGAGAPGRA